MIERLTVLFCTRRLLANNEAQLQEAIERLLIEEKIEHVREHRLGKAGRIDFYVPSIKLGIEIKVEGTVTSVSRQLLRYAEVDEITALMLVSTRARLTEIPGTLNEKPVTTVCLCQNGF